jgi:hypothetical protein
MHPLPRVNELDASFDSDRRAVYFQQAAYGVPIRMALISLLLHLNKNKTLRQFDSGFAKSKHPIYVQPIGVGLQCDNPNCITGDPSERQYAANKFFVVEEDTPQHCKLRCVYCEKDVSDETAAGLVVGDTTKHIYSEGLGALVRGSEERLRHLVIHRSAKDAAKAGFVSRTPRTKARAS